MSNDKMREEFEARAKAEQGLDLTRLPHGGYRSFATHHAWWAWQASCAAQDAQGEPVGWQFYESGKWWNGDDRIKDHRKNTEAAGVPVRDVYAAPQPGIPETLTQEQQPVPDVSALVDALVWYSDQVSGCRKTTIEGEQCRASLDRDGGAIARAALDTYRKQGVQP